MAVFKNWAIPNLIAKLTFNSVLVESFSYETNFLMNSLSRILMKVIMIDATIPRTKLDNFALVLTF